VNRLATNAARLWPTLRALLRGAAAACAAIVAVVLVGFACVHESLIDEADLAQPLDPVAIVDRDGVPLRQYLPGGVDRRWVRLSDVSDDVVRAFLAAEDARFYEHGAVDPQAVLRAIAVDLVPGGRVSGASTITQQVVKLVYGRPHGVWDKPLEVARAFELERRYTKDEILEQYLNRVPMGNGIVGVERAAWAYFGRSARDLSLAQAAVLAGIPQAPSVTEPRRHLARARRRQGYVLDRLAALGWRAEEDVERARQEPLDVVAAPPRPWRAPRFVDRVLTVRRERGLTGRTITTSLSAPLTDEVSRVLTTGIAPLEARGAHNAAAVVVRNADGEILAYVGAADPEGEGGALDLLAAPRQPGSTLKPFAYALFFEGGAGPATPVDDLARPMTGRGGVLYLADDFDGRERGPVPARLALASSLNLAALDVVSRVGPSRFVERLGALGLSHAARADRDSAAMVLGGVDATALELAAAYATLARGGTRVPLSVLPADASEGTRVIDASAAALVTDVLSDPDARRAGFGRDLAREAGDAPFALKTGTSQGFRDAWAAVYDADFTVVVWVGDPSGEPMDGVAGFEAAAPLAVRSLAAARAMIERSAPSAPTDHGSERPALATVAVCAHSGLLPGPHCHHVVREHFAPDAIPHATCDAHADDGTVLLASRYADWVRRAHPAGAALAPTAPSTAPPRVSYPRDGATLLSPSAAHPPEITLRAALGEQPTDAARFEVDGTALASNRWPLRPGHHVLVAVVDGRRSAPSSIEVLTP
jgi:penicillin-binding protein 1C